MVVVAVAIIILVELMLRKSRYGRALYLTGSNYNAARLCGIKTNRVISLAYVFSGGISALAGLFFGGSLGFGQMGMGASYTMLSVAAAVIGGIRVSGGGGNLIGASLGAIVLVLLTTILTVTNMNAGSRDFLQGVILVVILIVDSRAPKIRQ
jgi:ribose transport system permease protein